MSLKGKVALVTGSTSGIGLGIARALGAEGADLMLNGFGDAAMIEKLRTGLAKELGVRVLYSGADISKSAEIAAMVAQTQEALGSLDILVNNAGIQFVANVEDFPEDRWNSIIAVNLSGVFFGMKAAIPGMKAKGWGRIINIASAHGLVASPQKVAYVAAKHGVVGMTKVAAIELANHGITVNAICPGPINTPLVQSIPQHWRDAKQKELVIGRFGNVEEVAPTVVLLASDAGSYYVGATMNMNGGDYMI